MAGRGRGLMRAGVMLSPKAPKARTVVCDQKAFAVLSRQHAAHTLPTLVAAHTVQRTRWFHKVCAPREVEMFWRFFRGPPCAMCRASYLGTKLGGRNSPQPKQSLCTNLTYDSKNPASAVSFSLLTSAFPIFYRIHPQLSVVLGVCGCARPVGLGGAPAAPRPGVCGSATAHTPKSAIRRVSHLS